jgi:DNA-binding CsgD family transcriptional regulator
MRLEETRDDIREALRVQIAAPSMTIAEALLTDLQKGKLTHPDCGIGILCSSGPAHVSRWRMAHIRFTFLMLPPILILDRRLAYLPELHRSGVGTWVHEYATVAAFAQIFDVLWASASVQPVPSAANNGAPGPAEEELLSLLVRGLTYPAIARRLGVSLRTVERRVSRLAQDLGVNGRVQLVSEAARRSWL